MEIFRLSTMLILELRNSLSLITKNSEANNRGIDIDRLLTAQMREEFSGLRSEGTF
jgi:hypothetical protein